MQLSKLLQGGHVFTSSTEIHAKQNILYQDDTSIECNDNQHHEVRKAYVINN